MMFVVNVNKSKCLHVTSSKVLFSTHYVDNAFYHKFSHGDVSHMFKRENANIMLEFSFIHQWNSDYEGLCAMQFHLCPEKKSCFQQDSNLGLHALKMEAL